MIALYILLAVLVLFIAVLIIRTLRFVPKKTQEKVYEEINIDEEKTIRSMGELIKCKTVSYRDSSLEDDAEFEKLISLLPVLFPNVFKVCEFMRLPDRALLFRWKGKEEGKPAVMMAHYDVVPVEEALWDKPAFDAIIEDGVMWGRGTLDTKATFNGILSAADKLIEDGFIPENDIYFAFSGGEEINGKGASNIVDYFEEKGIELSFVIDEGGAVVENVFPGVKTPCALIGIAEKGMLDLQYEVESAGGHASAPPPHTPVGLLSIACTKVEKHPFKMHLTKPAALMFDTLGRHSSFLYRMIFANLWCFSPVIDLLGKTGGGEINALLRTTVAFTMMNGSKATNVIPPKASMVSNLRLNPEDTMESAQEYIKNIIKNDNIKLTKLSGMNPSRISEVGSDGWNKISEAVLGVWPGSIVSPYLMVQCSDCRHYGRISDKVYRFSAADLTSEERRTIHGNNEKIRLESIVKATKFYVRLMKLC